MGDHHGREQLLDAGDDVVGRPAVHSHENVDRLGGVDRAHMRGAAAKQVGDGVAGGFTAKKR